MKYASIVPLIGGATIAMQNVLQREPEYIISYDDNADNERGFARDKVSMLGKYNS